MSVPATIIINTNTDEASIVLGGLYVPGVAGIIANIATRIIFLNGTAIDVNSLKFTHTQQYSFSPQQASTIMSLGYAAIGEKIK